MLSKSRFSQACALCALFTLAGVAPAQIRVNPTGVNVSAQSATTVYLTFGGLGNDYVPVEALWCGALVSAAPDIGNRCDPATLFGRLPLRYDLSRISPTGAFTDIMSIPASVARRAYQAAESGQNSAFFYVRRFASQSGQPDQYVTVTCRLAGGGARVPLALTDVRISFDVEAPVLFLAAGSTPPPVTAEITYNGTGRLRGRWEVVQPGEQLPERRDLLTEATLPPEERGTQRRFTELERFDVFLPPRGKIVLSGPQTKRLPVTVEGSYLLLLRIEVSDDKEGDSNLAAAGAGTGVVHSGAVAGFPIPPLRYVVGSGGSEFSPERSADALGLIAPADGTQIEGEQAVDFTWHEAPRAALYRLEVETPDGTRVLSALVAPGIPMYRAPPWLAERAGGQALRWRVSALDMTGATIKRSAWQQFELTAGQE